MVTKRGPRSRLPVPSGMIALKSFSFSIEELERRLETALLHTVYHGSCDCLGTLCQCDGEHCTGICESHCLIHYV